eukprot:309127-Ditylum_brightwellii.AAC.1
MDSMKGYDSPGVMVSDDLCINETNTYLSGTNSQVCYRGEEATLTLTTPPTKAIDYCTNFSSSSSYKRRGKHGDLGGKHWWFRPGHIAKNEANYLIWHPVYFRSQWVPTCGLYTEISVYLGTDEIRRRLKVMPYVLYQSCRAGSRLQGSEIDPI